MPDNRWGPQLQGIVVLLALSVAVFPGCSYYIVRDGKVDQQRVLELKQKVARMRGLEFTENVEVKLIDEEHLADYLDEQMEVAFPQGMLTHLENASISLGLLPPESNLKEDCKELVSKYVSGFYNFRTGELYLTPHAYQRAFWLKVVEFFKQRDLVGEILIAHELTHALQDQHFKLRQTYERAYLNLDEAMALAALVEGDALLLNLEQVFQDIRPDHFRTEEAKLKAIRDTIEGIGEASENMKDLRGVPVFVRQSVVFPYTDGLNFASRLYFLGGWEAINKALAHPPESTEQVLHPEKFLPPRDEPQQVIIQDTLPLSTWENVAANTLGELGIRSMLRQYLPRQEADPIAEGWGGDLLQLYQHRRDNRSAVIWKTVWDSEADAQQFAQGFMKAFALAFPELGAWQQLPPKSAGAGWVSCYEAKSQEREVKLLACGVEVEVRIITAGQSAPSEPSEDAP